jgi:hypothetical protein
MAGYELTPRGLASVTHFLLWGTAEKSGGALSCLEPRSRAGHRRAPDVCANAHF